MKKLIIRLCEWQILLCQNILHSLKAIDALSELNKTFNEKIKKP